MSAQHAPRAWTLDSGGSPSFARCPALLPLRIFSSPPKRPMPCVLSPCEVATVRQMPKADGIGLATLGQARNASRFVRCLLQPLSGPLSGSLGRNTSFNPNLPLHPWPGPTLDPPGEQLYSDDLGPPARPATRAPSDITRLVSPQTNRAFSRLSQQPGSEPPRPLPPCAR